MNAKWTFVTNHLLVLVALDENADVRQRDIADQIGITQGAVQRILHDLVEAQYITAERVGRRNTYRLNEAPMRHAKLGSLSTKTLLEALHMPLVECAEPSDQEQAA